MEEKEVKNEEIKEENDKEKNNSPKKWKKILIVGVIALIIIAAGIGIWYFLIRDKETHNIDIIDDKIIDNNTNISSNKVDEIISKYNHDNKVNYDVIDDDRGVDSLISYYIVDDTTECEKKTLLIVYNKENDLLLRFDDKSYNDYIVSANQLYIRDNNEILKYDLSNGKLVSREKYDYINGYLMYNTIIASKNNQSWMFNEYNDFQKELLTKGNEYFGNNVSMTLYKDSDGICYVDYYEKNNCGYPYNGINQLEDNEYIENFEDDTYITYTFGGGQCGNNILINKNNNKIEKTGSLLGFIKTDNGYYLKESECWTEGGPTHIYTAKWEELGILFKSNFYDDEFNEQKNNSLDNEGNVYVYNNGYVFKYDVNGNELYKSQKHDDIDKNDLGIGKLIDNSLYYLAVDNKALYLCNTTDNEKVEIITNYTKDNLINNVVISYDGEKIEIYFHYYDNDSSIYTYNLKTKELKKLN